MSSDLIPLATLEEIVEFRDKALKLYEVAHDAISTASEAVKDAAEMARRASPGITSMNHTSADEVKRFNRAVACPERGLYLRTAQRLVDLNVWAWVVDRAGLERLMDKEAKDKLRAQMQYIPDGGLRDHRGQLITGEEVAKGMPPVTLENIYATLNGFKVDAESIFRRGIANAFSKLDRRFKSHDGFKVGSRVILTHAFDGNGSWNYHSNTRDTLMDIERTFSILDGKEVTHNYASTIGAIDEERSDRGYRAVQSEIDTPYFKIRIFQNGNAHLWMLRKDLVTKVNRILAEWYGEVIADGETTEADPFANPKTLPAKRYGFYPTPPDAIKTALRDVPLYQARDQPRLAILEPSAGTGALAKACMEVDRNEIGYHARGQYRFDNQVDCIEIQPHLAEQLRAEGLFRRVTCADFLTVQPNPVYDRVIMNPPFDLERDIDHVYHAMKFLKPDGFLMAIMSAGTTFRETKKAVAFRKLVKDKGGNFRDLPPGSFSAVGTNVNTVVVRLWNNGRNAY